MSSPDGSQAPLHGLRIVEFAGLGPGPFAAMMLADMGADVIRIERPGAVYDPHDFLARGRRSIVLDLKRRDAVELAKQLIAQADGLIEGFRPGVMERLGLGPEQCHAKNRRLVYGRVTGWGQDGPLAHAAGHDLNYIALTGALWATGEADRPPTFPANLLGDFGGGGMYLAFGMVAGLLKAACTGHGDVVDAAITDGTHSLMTFIHARRASGRWQDARGANSLDGGAPWYAVYECACGGWVSVAAIEPKFWTELLARLDLDDASLGDRSDPAQWPRIRKRLTAVFLGQTRDHWVTCLEGSDACFAPVLSPSEATAHPHNIARGGFVPDGPDQPMPAPRFASAAPRTPSKPLPPGAQTDAILAEIGLTSDEIEAAKASGVVPRSATKENAS
ncbi:MAG: CaiB/BaiF CoA-transferase family protein [Pseudomonadota bacterium]